MKNIASLFSTEARKELKDHLGIELSEGHDYSDDELNSLYDAITDEFPYDYDENGNPGALGSTFESIIDVFAKNKLIKFD